MLSSASALRGPASAGRSAIRHVPVGLLALALGLGLALLPLPTAAVSLLLVAIILITLVEPMAGLGLALIVGPLRAWEQVVLPGVLPVDSGQLALAFSLAAWFVRRVADRERVLRWAPLAAPLLAYIAIGAASLLGALSLGYGLRELLKWIEVLIVMLVVFTTGRKKWGWLIGAFLLAGALQGGIGIWQFVLRGTGPEGFLIGGRLYRAYGTFEQPNPFAGFLGLVLMVSLGLILGQAIQWFRDRSRRRLALLALLLAATGLVAGGLIGSYSRGAWLGAAAGLIVIILGASKQFIVGLLLLAVVAGLAVGLWQAHLLPASLSSRAEDILGFLQVYDVRGVDITDTNYSVVERLAHWQAAEGMIRDHPWLGVGLGNYEPVYPAYQLLNWPYPLGHAHNIYLNTAAETGVIGLAAYSVFWLSVFGLTVRAITRLAWPLRGLALGLLGGWVHLSIHGILDNLYVNNVPLHIGMMLGVLCILTAQEYRK